MLLPVNNPSSDPTVVVQAIQKLQASEVQLQEQVRFLNTRCIQLVWSVATQQFLVFDIFLMHKFAATDCKEEGGRDAFEACQHGARDFESEGTLNICYFIEHQHFVLRWNEISVPYFFGRGLRVCLCRVLCVAWSDCLSGHCRQWSVLLFVKTLVNSSPHYD